MLPNGLGQLAEGAEATARCPATPPLKFSFGNLTLLTQVSGVAAQAPERTLRSAPSSRPSSRRTSSSAWPANTMRWDLSKTILKFGDPRVMALMMSLCAFGCLIDGFRSQELRWQIAALLGVGLEQYSASQMSYDLQRLVRIFVRPHSHQCSINCIQSLIEPSPADYRFRTGSIHSSGISQSQSCLKNSAHLSNFFGTRTG